MTEYIYDYTPNKQHAKERVVRCKDCTRFIPQGTYRFNSGVVNKDTCNVIRGFVVQIDPDGFCAWGVSREAPDPTCDECGMKCIEKYEAGCPREER